MELLVYFDTPVRFTLLHMQEMMRWEERRVQLAFPKEELWCSNNMACPPSIPLGVYSKIAPKC